MSMCTCSVKHVFILQSEVLTLTIILTCYESCICDNIEWQFAKSVSEFKLGLDRYFANMHM